MIKAENTTQKEAKALDLFFFTDRQQKFMIELLKLYIREQTDYNVQGPYKPIPMKFQSMVNPFTGWTKTDLAHARRLLKKLKEETPQ